MRGWGGCKGLDLAHLQPEEAQRFWTKVDKNGPRFGRSRCWVFTGDRGQQRNEYPQWAVPGLGLRSAHQVFYAITNQGGLAPDTIMTKQCSTRRCIRHWKACTASEAARGIKRATTTVPVDEIRALRLQGATCGDVADEFAEFGHRRVRSVLMNRTFPESGYEPGRRWDEHGRKRFSPETIEEIRLELAKGASVNRIARWLGAPTTTVWEAVHGPSLIARRAAG